MFQRPKQLHRDTSKKNEFNFMKTIFRSFSLLLIICCCMLPAAAQMRKADKLYKNLQYAEAIMYLKRAAHGKNKSDALTKLADCYRQVKNYPQAELVYAKLVVLHPNDALLHFYYAEALMNNKKYEDAKKEYSTYATMRPDDKTAKSYVYACDEMKTWNTIPSNYKVYNLGSVNSPVSDFSPVIFRDGLVFVSESPVDLVSGSENAWTGNPYSCLFYSKGEKKDDSVIFGKGRPLSPAFNNDALNSTACFSKDQTEIYFTRADNKGSRNKDFVNHPKIYMSKAKGNSWRSPELLPFNSDDYSNAHPALSGDGQTLYFSSTMPGGFGGADLYRVKRSGDTWGKPENLGPMINTPGDEMYPQFAEDGRLYFSSNGLPGYGGLDIFTSIWKDNKWSRPSNMNPPINSSRDDFSIVFKDAKSGYFSSNRDGGKGSDDIYGFVRTGKIDALDGKILQSKTMTDGAGNVNVLLLTDKGDPIQHTITDNNGFFRFDNLTPDQKYMVKLDADDPNALKQKYYLADNQDRIVRVTVKTQNGLVIFNSLPSDLKTLNPLVDNDVDGSPKFYSIAGSLLMGDDKTPLSETKVNLKNDKGETIQTTTTNGFGSFVFTNLPSDQNYLVTLDDNDPTLMNKKIFLVNKSGKELASSDKGVFKYQIFASDKMMLTQLTVKEEDLLADMKGRIFTDDESKKPLQNSKVKLIDDKGNVIQTTVTDNNGVFNFANLPADKKFLIVLDETDAKVKNDGTYYVTDEKGNIIRKMLLKGGKYTFEVLPSESRTLSNIYFDDPWLQVQKLKQTKTDKLTVIENIYYDYGSADLLDAARVILDKVIQVMKQDPDITIELDSHTDSRGTDEFNMTLSQKRAQTAVDYMASKGIDKKRLSGKGFGESKLLNKCKDGVECNEDEHAQNRRVEFKITKKK
jgi:outer membrane protein OmpA-like peptidoglycan-associated protein/tetratricopeptide (TPR) repeat protein